MSLPTAILVDLDGTLTNVDHRVHHVQDKTNVNWKAFSEEMVNDELNDWCFQLIEAMKEKGHKIIFVTGRGEAYRKHTEQWLSQYKIDYLDLYMRALKDKREDSIIKEEIYRNHVEGKYDVLFVIEDRASVVKMWRDIGLTCLQCDWGDF